MMYPPAHYQSDNTALLNTLVAEFPQITASKSKKYQPGTTPNW